MSKKRPQNGPSLSAAPAKSRKPLSDAELAQLHAFQSYRDSDAQDRAQKSREEALARKSRSYPTSFIVRG